MVALDEAKAVHALAVRLFMVNTGAWGIIPWGRIMRQCNRGYQSSSEFCVR